MSSGRGLTLGAFVADLRSRLAPLSRDDLTRLLLAHAERLPTSERAAFLAIFPDPTDPTDLTGPATARPEHREVDDGLPQRVRDFAARVAAGDYDDPEEGWDDGWQGRYGWDDAQPVPAWVADADALFAEASEVFLTADAQHSREVYDLLLDLFRPDPPGLPETLAEITLDIWSLEATDVPEALARYVRCVYETTPAAARANALGVAWSTLPWSPEPLSLAQVTDTRPVPLPDLAGFLPAWIDQLVGGADGPPARERVRLLAEAAHLHHGLDTLADLARRPGPHQGGISRIRVDALAAAGRPGDAADAAREAVTLPGLEPGLLAGLNDRLADLCAATNDLPGAVRARQDAWRALPSHDRLIAMVDDARTAQLLDDALTVEAAQVLDAATRTGAGPDRLGCEVLLLAGLLDPAVAALTASEPLGWSRLAHPGPVVLPCLWAAATAIPRDGLLRATFTAIDTLHDTQDHERLFRTSTPDNDNPWTTGRASTPARERPTLTALLTEALTTRLATASQPTDLIDIAQRVTDARIDAIVSNKHRSAYSRAAALTFAHAEALTTRSPDQGAAYMSEVRARYPRHVAFRQELDSAAKATSLRSKTRTR
ncbi:hypothetical protein [Kineosporia sp. A_224]|uniref:hypothetical protein n=1 Tax=Kineosporia sp. A_224 TaxID=1962180 RepID=UPI001179BF5F|nr:hypothetical protein [Kineosporia sp. A_224]